MFLTRKFEWIIDHCFYFCNLSHSIVSQLFLRWELKSMWVTLMKNKTQLAPRAQSTKVNSTWRFLERRSLSNEKKNNEKCLSVDKRSLECWCGEKNRAATQSRVILAKHKSNFEVRWWKVLKNHDAREIPLWGKESKFSFLRWITRDMRFSNFFMLWRRVKS